MADFKFPDFISASGSKKTIFARYNFATRYKTNLRFYLVFCILGPVNSYNTCIAKEKLSLKAGFGITELVNAGTHSKVSQFQFGLYIGGYPKNGDKTLTI